MLVLKVALEQRSGARFTWDFFFSVLEDRGALNLLIEGAVVQAILAIVVAIGAFLTYQKPGRKGMAIAVACVGAFGVVFSFLVLGGIFGILGGMLSIAAGLEGGFPKWIAQRKRPHPEVDAPEQPPFRTQVPFGEALLVGACCLHVVAVPISLIVLKALVEQGAGGTLSWGQLFAAVDAAHLLPLLVAFALVQFLFAFVAAGGTLQASRGKFPAVPMVIAGIIAIPASIILLGGIVGALGGCFSIVSGIWEMTHRNAGRQMFS